ncbi:Flp family type IVb pilin [Streptomyces sp. NPDC008122]|uniref:Flp family type IVb pilin n=1 Tax=Streptomyces sp. NPDC008122 TaxID=3364810 RepID=UPI0036EAB263
MNDAMLKALTKGRVRLGDWTSRRSRDRGQTAVEYLGIIVVVVAIVIAITGTDIGSTIMTAIKNKIAELTG